MTNEIIAVITSVLAITGVDYNSFNMIADKQLIE